MSLTPSTPQFSLKSFWQRPEGRTGTVVLLVASLAAVYGGVVFLPTILAAVASIMQSLFLMAVTGIGLFAVLYTVFNPTFRTVVRNLFQLTMRWMTGAVIELDPIGILKNNLLQMNHRKDELDTNVSQVSGAKKNLEMAIRKKQDAIDHAKSLVDQATRKLQTERDPIQKQTLTLSRQTYLTDIGMKAKSIENLQSLLTQTARIYDMLQRWRGLAEYQIQTTSNQVEELAEQRRTILSASKALSAAKRLIKGDPEQLAMVNQTLEFLAEDTANKLGDMEDFAKYSEKFLTQMDLEQGAAAEDAEKMLTQFETKLLTVGSQPESVPAAMPHSSAEPVAVGRASKGALDGQYFDDLK